jgi:hypothetical protein
MKKIFIIMLFCIVSFSSFSSVSATTMKLTGATKIKVDAVYTKFDNNLSNYDISKQTEILNRTISKLDNLLD